MDHDEKIRILEGILFAMGNSVPIERIAQAMECDADTVKSLSDELGKYYEENGRGIRIRRLEDSLQLCTDASIYEYLIRIAKQPKKAQLTDVLLETLSIVAYKQPVTKAEIEKIRGVSCGHAISKLIDYELVEEVGRLDAPGRPMLFATTEEFLRTFDVKSIEELPKINPVMVEEFKLQAESEVYETLEVKV